MLQRLEARGWTLGVAESLTGGLIGARIANVPGASRTFRGSIASYATEVKRSVLGVTAEQVVSKECAEQMAEGARGCSAPTSGIAATGVAGPGRAGRSAGRHRVVRARAARGSRSKPCRPACPATASASGSSRRSRCSTSCGCGSTPSPDREREWGSSARSSRSCLRRRCSTRSTGCWSGRSRRVFAWTRRDQWHITLQFYGRVDDVDRAARRRSGPAAAASDPVRIAMLRGGGAFPKPKKAQVLWLGVDDSDALIDLHAAGRGRDACLHRPARPHHARAAPDARPPEAHAST